MRFALTHFPDFFRPDSLPHWPRILPLALLLTALPGCSSPQIAGNEPPTPRAVTRAEMEATPTPPPRPPMPPNAIPPEPPREKKGWFAPINVPQVKLPKPPKLWPFGGEKKEERVAANAAPEPDSKPKKKPTPGADRKPGVTELAAEALNPPGDEPAPEKKPGLFTRAAGALPFVGPGDDSIAPPPRLPKIGSERPALPEVPKNQRVRPRSKDLRGLEMLVELDPQVPSASQDRRISVKIVLYNDGKASRALRFGSTQTREILIRDANGALITRWSEDYVFDRTLTGLLINPGERIEFKETISTRDLAAGRQYLLDVGIQGYSELQVSLPLNVRP